MPLCPPAPTITAYGEAETGVVPVAVPPPPPPPALWFPPPPPPATTSYSTASPKVPGAVTSKVPDEVKMCDL